MDIEYYDALAAIDISLNKIAGALERQAEIMTGRDKQIEPVIKTLLGFLDKGEKSLEAIDQKTIQLGDYMKTWIVCRYCGQTTTAASSAGGLVCADCGSDDIAPLGSDQTEDQGGADAKKK